MSDGVFFTAGEDFSAGATVEVDPITGMLRNYRTPAAQQKSASASPSTEICEQRIGSCVRDRKLLPELWMPGIDHGSPNF